MNRTLVTLFLLFSVTGCFQTSLFIRDFIITSPGMDKGSAQVPYHYLGCYGPHHLSLENKKGVRGNLEFEAFSFPNYDKWDDYNLHPSEGEALSIKARRVIRDYFGSPKEIELLVFKKVAPDYQSHAYLIDAKLESSLETIGERLVESGLARVNHDLAKMAGAKTLIRLEDAARRARRGIWQYAPIHNPNWHD